MAVRRESVLLELQDSFSTEMAKAAAATALLNRELNSLSGQAVRTSSSARTVNRDIDATARSANNAGPAIDRLSGRIGLLGDALLTLGPGLIPLGGAATAGIAALASSASMAAIAGGSMVVAFGGVGTALEAVNKAHLEPTKDNLKEAEKALKRLAPEARKFVEQLDSMRGLGGQLRDAGANALFPGLIEALETLESRGPDAERILVAMNETMGEIAAEGAASLASDRWDDFFDMLATEGPVVLDLTADAIGNVVHGLSEMWEAFAPLNRDTLGWIGDITEDFDKWAQGLEDSKGFEAFTRYIRRNGPQLQETIGAVVDALVGIVEAAAPLAGPSLRAIETFADAVARVADSGLATPLLAALAAMRAINRLAPRTAGSLALLSGAAGRGAGAAGAAAAGGAVVAGGGDGKDAPKKRAPRIVGRGPGAGAAVATWLGLDILTSELGWQEASDKQQQNAETFFEQYGRSVSDQAERLRVRLSKSYDVQTGSGPFGLLENDEGLSNELALQPIEDQIRLNKDLREEYGLGFKALERNGVLVEGFTANFRRQKDAVDPLARDIERLGKMKAEPEVDLDDKSAKRKARENDDWITKWGRKNAKAEVDADNRRSKKAINEAENMLRGWGRTEAAGEVDADNRKAKRGIDDASRWLQGWGRSSGAATVDAITGAAQAKMEQVAATLARIDGTRAYTEIVTHYKVVRSTTDAIAPRGRRGGSYATGGYTGDGGKYEPAGVVHRGELVLPQEIVKRDWSALKAKYGHLPGFADGGMVGTRTLAPNVSVAAPEVNVDGPAVRVFIDGQEVRNIVRSEQAKADDFDRWMSRG